MDYVPSQHILTLIMADGCFYFRYLQLVQIVKYKPEQIQHIMARAYDIASAAATQGVGDRVFDDQYNTVDNICKAAYHLIRHAEKKCGVSIPLVVDAGVLRL